ncbi:MAG: histidinol dehydrogenase [Bacteroidetes bacterium]|nr:histidinol dehydrogenase [Bacteroidota bacterium]MBU1373239.1 histidinol dehydrogenase [Bacteroidota bacterium]MBU1486311.1 histidinol dehydrogenase [Bacteroidota bacterium]MBU1761185.1 histidinol dehydrogenase [Bacteroidota bacterium]MBU2269269.1 histidinol dehydrogenase [Bacteroidota bacterium]
MKQYNYKDLSKVDIQKLVARNVDANNRIRESVETIISEVKAKGDEALKSYALKFDGVDLDSLFIEKEEINRLANQISEKTKNAINIAYQNIKKFHETQISKEEKVETTTGVTCWREARAIERVGLYIPGGTAVLPSTFLMLGVPAKIAGCKEIVVCSPPQKSGEVNGYLAYVAQLLGINKIYLAGGAQAVTAMAYGTESIPKVDKIFGPGNQYVTMAKTLVQSTTNTAIDMPAGPSEVLVIADETANPIFVASDLLAQAEHGVDSQAVLVCSSQKIIDKTILELEKQLFVLPRKEIAAKAIDNSYVVLVKDLQEAMTFSNEYAPEHLILATDNWQKITDQILNAGSVFAGNLTPESAGDYASGTNHTLPTSAYARSYSGVSLDSFVKKITFQHISESGIKNLGPSIEILAEIEGLQAHKNAVSLRLKEIKE